MGRPRVPLSTKFWQYVAVPADDSGCWLWEGGKSVGYGVISFMDGDLRKTTTAHRIGYELMVGPIPEGMHVDHLCRNPSCVNPAHLEPVTPRENSLRGVGSPAQNARKTHCKRGHEFTAENTRVSKKYGNRACRKCERLKKRDLLSH